MKTLQSAIDPADPRWIWLSHTDFDHIGSLHQLPVENPRLRSLTAAPGVHPFAGPNQAAFEQMLKLMAAPA